MQYESFNIDNRLPSSQSNAKSQNAERMDFAPESELSCRMYNTQHFYYSHYYGGVCPDCV